MNNEKSKRAPVVTHDARSTPKPPVELDEAAMDAWLALEADASSNATLVSEALNCSPALNDDELLALLLSRPVWSEPNVEQVSTDILRRLARMAAESWRLTSKEARVRDNVLDVFGMLTVPVRHPAGMRHPTDGVVTFSTYGGQFDMTVGDAMDPKRFVAAYYSATGDYPRKVDTETTPAKWRSSIQPLLTRARPAKLSDPPRQLIPAIQVFGSFIGERASRPTIVTDLTELREILDEGRVAQIKRRNMYSSWGRHRGNASCEEVVVFSMGPMIPALMSRIPSHMLHGFSLQSIGRFAGWTDSTVTVPQTKFSDGQTLSVLARGVPS